MNLIGGILPLKLGNKSQVFQTWIEIVVLEDPECKMV